MAKNENENEQDAVARVSEDSKEAHEAAYGEKSSHTADLHVVATTLKTFVANKDGNAQFGIDVCEGYVEGKLQQLRDEANADKDNKDLGARIEKLEVVKEQMVDLYMLQVGLEVDKQYAERDAEAAKQDPGNTEKVDKAQKSQDLVERREASLKERADGLASSFASDVNKDLTAQGKEPISGPSPQSQNLVTALQQKEPRQGKISPYIRGVQSEVPDNEPMQCTVTFDSPAEKDTPSENRTFQESVTQHFYDHFKNNSTYQDDAYKPQPITEGEHKGGTRFNFASGEDAKQFFTSLASQNQNQKFNVYQNGNKIFSADGNGNLIDHRNEAKQDVSSNMAPNPNTDPNFTANDKNTVHARLNKTVNDYGEVVRKEIEKDSPSNASAQTEGAGQNKRDGMLQGPKPDG